MGRRRTNATERGRSDPHGSTGLRTRAENALAEKQGLAEMRPVDTERLVHELQVHQIELEMQNEELQSTQRVIAESREKYVDLYDFAPVGYFTFDAKGLTTEVNLTGASLLGIERSRLIGKPFILYVSPQDRDVFFAHHRTAQKSGRPERCELSIQHKDGSLIFVLMKSIAVSDNAGGMITRSAVTDITERKRMEDELARYQLLARHGRDIILFVRRSDGRIIEANDAAAEAYGYSKEELFSLNIYDLRGPKGRPLTDAQMDAADTSGILFETEHRRKDGTTFPVEVSSRGISIGAERILLSVIRDVAERKQAEDTTARLAAIVESSDDAIIGKSSDGTILTWNNGAERLYGYSAAEAVGRLISFLVPPHLHEDLSLLLIRIKQGEHIRNFETTRQKKDGTTVDVSLTISPIFNSSGETIGASTIARDVTERKRMEDAVHKSREQLKLMVRERTAELQESYDRLVRETMERARLEEQLRQAQKIEAIGTLTAGIAHDFNNILAAVIGFGELARDRLPTGTRERLCFDRITEAGLRGRDLVRRMLTFSRQAEQERRPLQLSSAIEETVGLLRASIPSTIDVRMKIESESGFILGDPVQLQQVIMNLCTNATHAMRDKGGILHIELSDYSVATSSSGRDKARLLHEARRPRHRRWYSSRRHRENLRPFLHHKGAGRGHGPGSFRRSRYRQEPRRSYRGRERAR